MRIRTAVLGLMTAGALAAAAPAGAAIGPVTGAKLSLQASSKPICPLTVDGTVPMTQSEAQALITSGHHIVVRLWGEDPYSDDLLAEYHLWRASILERSYISVTSKGLRFRVRARETARRLDEDNVHDLDGDELYAGVRLVDGRGRTVRAAETNRVYGTFAHWSQWTGYCG